MTVRQLVGDCREMLRTLEPGSIAACITSPPYYALRSYVADDDPLKPFEIGLEKTPDLYIEHLVEVFREVRRVLAPTGVVWCNLGDSYSGSGNGSNDYRENGASLSKDDRKYQGQRPGHPLPAKNLLMMPFRVAMALQADWWTLRSVIPWLKRNSMPESVNDRPATSVEYIFLLAKQPKYFWDSDAVRSPHAAKSLTHRGGGKAGGHPDHQDANGRVASGNWGTWDKPRVNDPAGRNLRNADFFFQTWQGLLLDEQDDPLALIVNPAPFSAAKVVRHYGGSSGSRRKVSRDCPVHGLSPETRTEQTAEYGGPLDLASPDNHSLDTSTDHGQGPVDGPGFATHSRGIVDYSGATHPATKQADMSSYRTVGLFDAALPQTTDGIVHIQAQSEVTSDAQPDEAGREVSNTSAADIQNGTLPSTVSVSRLGAAAPRTYRGIGRTQQTADSTSDSEGLTSVPIATDRSSETHKTDRAQSTNLPCKPSAQNPDGIPHIEGSPGSFDSVGRISENSTEGPSSLSGSATDPLAQTPSHSERKCTCQIIDHFATFPAALVIPLIKASTSERGQCNACGAPWVRVVEAGTPPPKVINGRQPAKMVVPGKQRSLSDSTLSGQEKNAWRAEHPHKTISWRPSCDCRTPCNEQPDGQHRWQEGEDYCGWCGVAFADTALKPVPQTVLDPFGGSGTTALVADRLGRNAVLIDLQDTYTELARQRVTSEAPMFTEWTA